VRGKAGAGPDLVVAKGHVHAPVQAVFHAPVLADAAAEDKRIWR
jgi:hypothetical protein